MWLTDKITITRSLFCIWIHFLFSIISFHVKSSECRSHFVFGWYFLNERWNLCCPDITQDMLGAFRAPLLIVAGATPVLIFLTVATRFQHKIQAIILFYFRCCVLEKNNKKDNYFASAATPFPLQHPIWNKPFFFGCDYLEKIYLLK